MLDHVIARALVRSPSGSPTGAIAADYMAGDCETPAEAPGGQRLHSYRPLEITVGCRIASCKCVVATKLCHDTLFGYSPWPLIKTCQFANATISADGIS